MYVRVYIYIHVPKQQAASSLWVKRCRSKPSKMRFWAKLCYRFKTGTEHRALAVCGTGNDFPTSTLLSHAKEVSVSRSTDRRNRARRVSAVVVL